VPVCTGLREAEAVPVAVELSPASAVAVEDDVCVQLWLMTGVRLADSVLLGVAVGAGVAVSSFVTDTVPVAVEVGPAVWDGLALLVHVREAL